MLRVWLRQHVTLTRVCVATAGESLVQAVWYAALMRTSPRDEGLYPGYFPGYYKALTGLACVHVA